MCPANRDYCPNIDEDILIMIDEVDHAFSREHVWASSILLPADDASEWHCKYKIEVT